MRKRRVNLEHKHMSVGTKLLVLDRPLDSLLHIGGEEGWYTLFVWGEP